MLRHTPTLLDGLMDPPPYIKVRIFLIEHLSGSSCIRHKVLDMVIVIRDDALWTFAILDSRENCQQLCPGDGLLHPTHRGIVGL